MSTTDGPRDDDEREQHTDEDSVLPPGPRRSTYTPPPSAVLNGAPSAADSDDDLPEISFVETGPITVLYQLDDVAPDVPPSVPVKPLLRADPDARIPLAVPAPPPTNPEFSDAAPEIPGFEDIAAAAAAATAELEPDAAAEPDAALGNESVPEYEAVPESEPLSAAEYSAFVPTDSPASESVADEERVFEERVFEQPVFEHSVFEEPVFEEPLVEEAIPDDSIVVEPVVAESDLDDEAGDDDAVDEEVVEEAGNEPAQTIPVVEVPAFDLPVFVERVFEDRVAGPPVTEVFGDATETSADSAERLDPDQARDAPEAAVPAAPLDEAAQLAALAGHAPPAGRPWVPERSSMRNEELAALVQAGPDAPGGTLEAMEELERQLQLRADEKREFVEWQQSMLAVGTPEALAAVERVSPQFTDLVPTATGPIFAVVPHESPTSDGIIGAPPISPTAESVPLSDAPPPTTAAITIISAPPPTTAALSVAPPPPISDRAAPIFDAPPPSIESASFAAPPPLDAGPEVAPPPPANVPSVVAPPPTADVPADVTAPPASDSPAVVTPPPLVEPLAEPVVVVPPALPEAWDIPDGSTVSPEFDHDEPIFIEPLLESPAPLVEPGEFGGNPFVDQVFTGSVSVITGSVQVPTQQLDVDGDDPVDPTDQAPPFDDLLGTGSPGTAPVEPISSPRIPEDEVVLGTEQKLERPRVFSLELSSVEPTPQEQRVGRAARMFWLWFASNSSVVSLAFGAMLFSLGMSLRQAIVGILAGIAISFIPLGLGSLAGKRSGQPTMVVSRAAFGTTGNVLPAIISLVSRVFWGAVLLWFLAQGVAAVLVGAQITGGLSHDILVMIALIIGFVLALVVAIFGYGLIAKVQLVVTVLATILVVGLIALTSSYVDLSAALTFRDGSWMLAVTAAVLVFSFVGLLWANSAGDLARYQRPESSGAGTMLFSSFGATIPAFLLISYGSLLAASNPQLAEGLLSNPLDTLGRILPVWYPVPLIAATVLSLISGVIVTTYSGGFALQTIGARFSRSIAVVLVGILTLGVAFLLVISATNFTMLFRDLATTLAVPVAAWAGIFAADTMIRNRRYHTESLLKPGGIYPSINWVNLPMLLVITAVGFGLTTATVGWLGWQGYLFTVMGVPLNSSIAGSDLGVFVALILGLLTPIISGIPGIRRQESVGKPAN